jgi:host cell surface-exposed lipoprotein
MSNYQDPNVPAYGTPEYAAWYRKNVDPNFGQQPKKKRHVLRWVISGVAGFVALIVIISVATAGGGKHKVHPAAAAATLRATSTHARKPVHTSPPVTAPTTAARHTAAATHHVVAPKPAPTHTTAAPTHAKPAPTHVEATPRPAPTHAVAKPKSAPKPSLTLSESQAIESAESYLAMGGFSRAGLINQLDSSAGEGFSEADAVFAVDHVKVDWNEQAVESAKSYLQMGGFSRASLINQLTSPYGEQFTLAQATYAVDHLGL